MRHLRTLAAPIAIIACFSSVFWISREQARAQAAQQVRPLADYDPQVNALLGKLTLDEKIGQMTQPDQQFLKNIDDIEKYHLGSLLSGGDSDPKSGNDLQSWTDLYNRYQSRALQTKLHIPLLYGIDAVHGNNNVLGATLFPQNIALGCTRNPYLVEQIGQITAEEVRATGINWAFAPCVAVPQDIRWGRTYEGFSEDPDIVKELGAAAVRGLQWDGLSNPKAVLACAKHFAGDGGTVLGTGLMNKATGTKLLDHGDTELDEADFRKIHLAGYLATVPEGVGSIMPSYSSWNGVKCSANKHLLTDILKNEMGFQGFVISDYAALYEIKVDGGYKAQIRESINAGMDIVMVPEHYEEFFNDLKELVNEGAVPQSRIDDAVRRILRVKFAMGLMNEKISPLADMSLHKSFGSAEHRRIARQAIRESLVLLKNDHKVLPIAKRASRIHVAGKGADDAGVQSGGWTVTWQGKAGQSLPGTTTILAAMKKAARNVTYSKDGSGAEGATVGVAFIGEDPYAEMFGDKTDLHLSQTDVAVVKKLKAAGIPVVVVLLSGRPLFIEDIMSEADAIVAAWLPGSEGEGVADVLFGDYKPVGKLSFTWPKASSTSLHRGDPGYQTLFELGYGLKYEK
ncbi:MAG: glycoside hydrolase family 3 protein [Bryobacteraceae bacterium]